MTARIALALLGVYRRILSPALHAAAPLIGPMAGGCRFEPSCSAYAESALREHPLARALGLIVRRLGRCHPGSRGGLDPVPARRS